MPANGPFCGDSRESDSRKSKCCQNCQRDRELAHVHLVSSPRPAVRGPGNTIVHLAGTGQRRCARFTNPEPSLPGCEDRAADDRGLGACIARGRDVVRVSGRRPRRGRRARTRQRRRRGRGRARRASRRGRSRCRGRARRLPRGRARPRALASSPESAVQPAVRTIPSFTSSATTSRAPSAAAHGAGSGNAAVPTTTRSAPAASSASASSSERMPPEAWSRAGAIASATVRTSSGRARPARAPSRSTRWIARGARCREPPVRARPGRPRSRRPCRSRPMQAHGALAEHVDGGYHLDRGFEPFG